MVGCIVVNLVFKCPVCNASAELIIDDDKVSKIEKYIKEHGKSLTYSTYCQDGHHIAVLVSIKKDNEVLKKYIQEKTFEIANSASTKNKKDKDSIDWIIRQ